MSNGREYQRTEAATGNERRPTVDVITHLRTSFNYGCSHYWAVPIVYSMQTVMLLVGRVGTGQKSEGTHSQISASYTTCQHTCSPSECECDPTKVILTFVLNLMIFATQIWRKGPQNVLGQL